MNRKSGSLGIAGVRGGYGGILVIPPPKYPHLSSLPQRFPKTQKIYLAIQSSIEWVLTTKTKSMGVVLARWHFLIALKFA